MNKSVKRPMGRKRKSEPEEICGNGGSDRGLSKIEITAVSLPRECSKDESSYRAPHKKKRVIHEISVEKVETDLGGDAPRYNVYFRNVNVVTRDKYDIQHELQYEKTLRKATIWRKFLSCGSKEKNLNDPEDIENRVIGPNIYRALLTYAIAEDVGLKAAIFLKIRSLLLYVLFMFFLIFAAFGNFSTETYYFSEAVSSVFLKNCIFYNSEGQPNSFESISNLNDVMGFVEDCLKKGLAKGLWGQVGVDSGVVLLTTPRFRQVRVVKKTCVLALYDNIVCHDFFSEESESKETFGTGSAFVYMRTEEGEGDVWFRGYYTKYNSNGFTFLIPQSEVLSQGWVDISTSAIFIDFTLYSADSNLFCIVQFLFEFPPTGRIKSSYTSRAVFLTRYHSKWGHLLFFAELMFAFLNFLTTIQIMINLIYFKYHYFLTIGLLYTLATTILCWYAIYCLIVRFLTVDTFFETRFGREEFVDFQPVLRENVHADSIIVLACLFASFRVYGFLNLDLMEHLKITLQACLKNIVVFTIAFTIIVWAFVQVAYLLFGHSLERYRTFSRCFSELMKVTLGDLDYEGPSSILKTIGPIFILIYVIFVVFVFINMFFAIINGTFTFVANNIEITEESYFGFLAHCCRTVRVKFCKGHVAKEEEKKLKNSQRIRNLLLDSGYSNTEVRIFFCRYIVDDAQALDEAVFAKMWNLRIPPKRLDELKALLHNLQTALDLLHYKAEWLSQRIRHVKETRLGRKKK